MDKHIDYLRITLAAEHQLSHASNIIRKWNAAISDDERKVLTSIVPHYVRYLKAMLSPKKFNKNAVYEKVELLNNYYNFIHNSGYDNAFSSQGKFRPTILEEFLYLLFRDYVAHLKHNYDFANDSVLDSGAVKAYSNLYFKAKDIKQFVESPEIGVNEKDQDYAIYRSFVIKINDKEPIKIRIPAIAIEAKTYIDKTMLDSIIATAEKLKSGNPHTRFVAVAERYDVSFDVDPAYSRIDQIYVIRKNMRKNEWQDVDPEVVWRLVTETVGHIERPWSDIETRLRNDGVII